MEQQPNIIRTYCRQAYFIPRKSIRFFWPEHLCPKDPQPWNFSPFFCTEKVFDFGSMINCCALKEIKTGKQTAWTYFSHNLHRWVHLISKVYLPVSDKQFALVSCFNHRPLATLCHRVMPLLPISESIPWACFCPKPDQLRRSWSDKPSTVAWSYWPTTQGNWKRLPHSSVHQKTVAHISNLC